jgi:hypothetical protein
MTLTYLDSGVLIAAVREEPIVRDRVSALLVDPDRTFVSSAFVRLEVLPKATYHRRRDEVRFYDLFFERVDASADRSEFG